MDPTQELGRDDLERLQLEKLREVLEPVLETNAFYREKLNEAGVSEVGDLQIMDDYRVLPFTTKDELSRDQSVCPPYGSNLTFPLDRYQRIHQTSGTIGDPLRWLDTGESWQWMGRCWEAVYEAAGVEVTDRVYFAFSFGLFIGFWSAVEGAGRIGSMVIPGGGAGSEQRIKAMLSHEATVLVCTPTYALHLAEVAAAEGLDIRSSSVRITIHAGEPGASLPGTRARIEEAWGATCFDHAGATEVGAWGFECQAHSGMHLNEAEYIAEVLDPETGQPAEDGELVISNLGRVGMPVVRYRTGDLVKLDPTECECGRTFVRLDGGVKGRMDDVLIIRGVNVYPSVIENAVRNIPEIGEFAVDVWPRGELDELEVRIEVNAPDVNVSVDRVSAELRHALGIRVGVRAVPENALPRFELKARRVTDHRKQS